MPFAYDIPASPVTVETVIKKSRFIACASHVPSRVDASAFITQTRLDYPDARHHCSAFIAGAPYDVHVTGFDDDGEPCGTAGKPMLNVLTHKGVGEIIVVVVRYFGGIKLGAGGLVRAYSSATQAVFDQLPLIQKVSVKEGMIQCSYAQEQGVRHLLADNQTLISNCTYTDMVELSISVPDRHSHKVVEIIKNFSRGAFSIVWKKL